MLRRLGDSPVLTALVGAFCIAFSSILFELSKVSPSTGAFYRCVWAVGPLLLLAWWEDRRFGPRWRGLLQALQALVDGVVDALRHPTARWLARTGGDPPSGYRRATGAMGPGMLRKS